MQIQNEADQKEKPLMKKESSAVMLPGFSSKYKKRILRFDVMI